MKLRQKANKNDNLKNNVFASKIVICRNLKVDNL